MPGIQRAARVARPSAYALGPADPGPQAPGSRPPLVGLTLEDLGRAIDSLSQALPALADRLNPVLGFRLEGAQTGGAEAPKPTLPPLGEVLAINAEKVRAIEAAVLDLIERLEI